MKSPLVSVVMPVYNSDRFLGKAIESILNQTFIDFEFLIFDDGSTDRSREIIKEYAKIDGRIIPFYSDSNCGYVVHLNKGIETAKGAFVARMDSDDISLPTRFEQQIDLLLKNNDIDILGTSTIIIDKDGNKINVDYRETDPILLKWQTFFVNPFSHPTVMIRKTVFEQAGLYDASKIPSEDSDLWIRAFDKCDFCNIKEPLLYYRVHCHSISVSKKAKQDAISSESLRDHLQKVIEKTVPIECISVFKTFHKGEVDIPFTHYLQTVYLLKKLKQKFSKRFPITSKVRTKINKMVAAREIYLYLKLREHNFLLSHFYILSFVFKRPKYTFDLLRRKYAV